MLLDLPDIGLYRTTQPLPGHEDAIPAGVLVYVGQLANGGTKFVVRPGRQPQQPLVLAGPDHAAAVAELDKTLRKLPSEGFYILPETLEFSGGARWIKGAIVQLGYNGEGKGILFVGEWREDGTENASTSATRA